MHLQTCVLLSYAKSLSRIIYKLHAWFPKESCIPKSLFIHRKFYVCYILALNFLDYNAQGLPQVKLGGIFLPAIFCMNQKIGCKKQIQPHHEICKSYLAIIILIIINLICIFQLNCKNAFTRVISQNVIPTNSNLYGQNIQLK